MNHTINRIVAAGRIAVIFAWAVFLGVAWYLTKYAPPGKSGPLDVINPSYRWLSLGSAVALFCIGAALLLAWRDENRHHHHGGHDHGHEGDHDHEETGLAGSCCDESASPGELAFQALFLVPIVFSLFTTSAKTISAATIANRGVHELQVQAPKTAPVPAAIAPVPATTESAPATTSAPAPESYEEVLPPLSMTDLHDYLMMGAPAQLEKRQVDLIGQYFVDDRCGENEFIVIRIVVTCCLADAEVIGVRVLPKKPFKPGADAAGGGQRPDWLGEPGGHELAARISKLGPWVAVTGTLKMQNDRFGTPSLFVNDAVVSEVQPPDEILLYPRQRGAPW